MNQVLHILWSVVFSGIGVAAIVWVVWLTVKNSHDPVKAIFKVVFSIALVIGDLLFVRKMHHYLGGGPGDIIPAAAMAISIATCGMILSFLWASEISSLIASPLTSVFDGGNTPVEPRPYYSIAHSKRKVSKPLEAIVEIRAQLAKFPNDYEGALLLATIQAEDLKDLPAAELTLNHFCQWEKAPPAQVVAAITLLADWHLKIANDADSARATLQRIIEKYPDTAFSNAAAQRLAHLAGAEKILLSARDRQPVAVPVGLQSAGLRETMREIVPEDIHPDTLTAELVKQLEEHPLDTEARERLAIVYARHHHRLDLATHELVQLAEQPDQPPKQVAHWLNLLADLQIHAGADFETIRPTLEKIIELFPDLPVAAIARRRLSTVKLEIKGQQESSPGKALGEYEQNLGLKGSRFYSPRQL